MVEEVREEDMVLLADTQVVVGLDMDRACVGQDSMLD